MLLQKKLVFLAEQTETGIFEITYRTKLENFEKNLQETGIFGWNEFKNIEKNLQEHKKKLVFFAELN